MKSAFLIIEGNNMEYIVTPQNNFSCPKYLLNMGQKTGNNSVESIELQIFKRIKKAGRGVLFLNFDELIKRLMELQKRINNTIISQ